MLRIAYIISIVSVLLFVSCTSKSVPSGKEVYTDFPQEQELKGRTILLDTALFRYPFRLHSGDGKVVVLDLHGTDYFFHAFSYPDFRYLSSFGKRGDAPQDMHRRICFLPKTSDGMGLFCGYWMLISLN